MFKIRSWVDLFFFRIIGQNLKYRFEEGINWIWWNDKLGVIKVFGDLLMLTLVFCLGIFFEVRGCWGYSG